jgi:hypothetical protein
MPSEPSVHVGGHTNLPRSAAHPFYTRLNQILEHANFDAYVESLCQHFYANEIGRPGLPPGRYFRILLLGYFEELDSERTNRLARRFVERARRTLTRPATTTALPIAAAEMRAAMVVEVGVTDCDVINSSRTLPDLIAAANFAPTALRPITSDPILDSSRASVRPPTPARCNTEATS